MQPSTTFHTLADGVERRLGHRSMSPEALIGALTEAKSIHIVIAGNTHGYRNLTQYTCRKLYTGLISCLIILYLASLIHLAE